MEDDETAIVVTLVYGIRMLGENLEEISVLRHFLRAAPPLYFRIVSAIKRCVNLKTLMVGDLVGRYNAHDERLKLTAGPRLLLFHPFLFAQHPLFLFVRPILFQFYGFLVDRSHPRDTERRLTATFLGSNHHTGFPSS
jgi:hypothetical protein